MKLLITGGAGFIGSHFVRFILNEYPKYRVINLDKLTYCGNPAHLKDLARNPRHCFIKGDICNAPLVERLTKGVDIIVHLAAATHVDRSIKDAEVFVRTNVEGTQTLLKAALKHRVKRFIYVSTDEVYGSRTRGFFKENDLLNPSNPYAASKAAADLLVRSYFITHGMDVVIARSSNNFGPCQYPEKIIPLFVTRLMHGKKVPLYGNGHNVRDWIYVLDHCRAIACLMHKGKTGEIYNIAGNNYLSNLALTHSILKLMHKSPRMIQYVPDRLGHDWRYAMDTSKIQKLGFKTQFSFSKALSETVAWYQAQDN